MKHYKKHIRSVFIICIVIIIFSGVIFPYLLSSKSTELVVLGIALIILGAYFTIINLFKLFITYNQKQNEDNN